MAPQANAAARPGDSHYPPVRNGEPAASAL